MPVQAPRYLFTVRDFHKMAAAGLFQEDDRVELLAGEVVQAAPDGYRDHRRAGPAERLTPAFLPALGLAVSALVS